MSQVSFVDGSPDTARFGRRRRRAWQTSRRRFPGFVGRVDPCARDTGNVTLYPEPSTTADQLSGIGRGVSPDSARTWEGGKHMSKILNLQKLAAHVGEVEPAISISSCDSHSC